MHFIPDFQQGLRCRQLIIGFPYFDRDDADSKQRSCTPLSIAGQPIEPHKTYSIPLPGFGATLQPSNEGERDRALDIGIDQYSADVVEFTQ
ncbi:MAG: hypothetical protein E5V28_01900 [Mesorhizobium sp.]|nr:MAG: hypothetical protein E5V28_01900 [Mesorhizobium sp.]